jgi:cob(I)alamin adenosyltransferase
MNSEKKFKIYTKGGDKGETALVGGKRVVKYHPRIEAYGTVDELISVIAFVKEQKIKKQHKKILLAVQNHLMIVAAHLATDTIQNAKKLPLLQDEFITLLETEIDRLEEKLNPLSSFVLPGGNTASAACHMARTVCRRAERRVCELAGKYKVNENHIQYINRLSDYLFVLSRTILKESGVSDILWLHK